MSDTSNIKRVSPIAEEIAAIEAHARLQQESDDLERDIKSVKIRVESLLRNGQVLDKKSPLWNSVKKYSLEHWVYSLAHQLLVEEGISPAQDLDGGKSGEVGFW